MAHGDNFVECVSGQVGAPFIVCGDLAAHDAAYWLDYYAARYPGSVFRIGQAGTYVCQHGVPARGFCQHCEDAAEAREAAHAANSLSRLIFGQVVG